jgi:hypothetical protein
MWTATLLGLKAAYDFARSVPWPVYAVGTAFCLGFVAGCHGCG